MSGQKPSDDANNGAAQDEPSDESVGWIGQRSQEQIYWSNLGYASAIGCLSIALAYFDQREAPRLLMGVPASVVWFGMLGAVLCSLQGIIEHSDDYERKYNYWHIARPLIGAAVGLMSYLFLTVIVTLGGGGSPNLSSAPSAAGINLYHVAAFIVGYREDAFRDLVSRVTDLVPRPGNKRKGDDHS